MKANTHSLHQKSNIVFDSSSIHNFLLTVQSGIIVAGNRQMKKKTLELKEKNARNPLYYHQLLFTHKLYYIW